MSRPKLNKRIALLGSTGSIGCQTLEVLDKFEGTSVALLSARSNWELLARQSFKWHPEVVTIEDETVYLQLKNALKGKHIKIEVGSEAASKACIECEFDACVNGLVGVAGLKPSYNVLSRGIDLALANKESLVLAGDLLNSIAFKYGASILPVDSEHSAIFQCLQGEKASEVKRLILTASGGPFRNYPLEKIRNVSPAEALNHPTWKMGRKITIDSATLVNKGFEVIEAYHLFGVTPDRIDVRIHPVSIVHSMVEFADGSIKAQLGNPDMRHPIQYALTYPDRLEVESFGGDPSEWSPLEFFRVEEERFPCLSVAFKALEKGGTAPAALNGADEVAVRRFLDSEIAFGDIADCLAEVIETHNPVAADSLEKVLSADQSGREFAERFKS